MKHGALLVCAFLAGSCGRTTANEPPASPSSAPSTVATASASAMSEAKDDPPVVIPAGSGDYSAVLADATLYKSKKITFEELRTRVLARKLPPHPLGDAYLTMPVPQPPPGVPWNPLMMPTDWEHTWGEVAMMIFANKLTRDEYDRLHAAAHPTCPKS